MDVKVCINKAFYIPSGRVVVLNLTLAAVLTTFAFLLHYLPFELGDSVKQLASLKSSSVILALASGANFLTIVNGIDRYFLSKKQAIGPAIGMTVLAVLIYTIAWGAFQIGEGKQRFVLLTAHEWNLQDTINNLAAGALLAFLSSLALTHLEFFKDEEAYDFGPFQKSSKEWNLLIKKRLQAKDNEFSQDDHDRLKGATKSMLDLLKGPIGHTQPVAAAVLGDVKTKISTFDVLYQEQTIVSVGDYSGFPDKTTKLIKQLSRIL